MILTFANFKQVIPAQILTRGRDYVRQGQILDLSFDEEDMLWEAQVEGTEVYDVRIEQTATGSLICSCTCPYDMGEHCKHIAAILYAIVDTFPEQLGTKRHKKPVLRQTRHDKLRQRLDQTSREQLVTLLLDLAQQDRELLNQLLIRLSNGDAKPMDYRRVVKDALRTGRGDYGFLDYAGSNRAARKIAELLTQAHQWLEVGEIEKSVGLYEAVIDETVPVIPHADDSNGGLGDCLNRAVEGLLESVERQDEAGREALFTFCLERARRREFNAWDWGWDLLALAVDLVENPARRERFMAALDDIEAEIQKSNEGGFYNHYRLERIALFKLALIDRFEGKGAAYEFLHTHVDLDRVRMVLIERYIDDAMLDEAMRLIQEGITSSEQRRLPGLTNQYQALRVKLLQQGGDRTALIGAARALWLSRGDGDDFVLLKQTVSAAEWAAFVEGLIKDIRRKPEQLAWLYAQENLWNDLMALVKSSQQAEWLIEAYREPLESRFAEEIATLYEEIVETILVRAAGRNHYRQAVAYLRRIEKLDKTARAEAIVNRLKKQYANRPALLDELSRL